MNELKRALLDEYGGFADRRIKRLDVGDTFIADDRAKNDEDARGRLCPWFCTIFARVISHDRVDVRLGDGVPQGSAVSAWLAAHGIQAGPGGSLSLSISPASVAELRTLAAAFRDIVRPGGPRYSTAAYKYVCPRTAASLERLANVLDNAWGPHR